MSLKSRRTACAWAAASCLMVLLSGCSEPTQTRVIGMLSAEVGGLATVNVPATVTVAAPFTATITTFGSSNCTQVAGEQVTSSGGLLRVVPLDEVPIDGRACFRDLAPFEHHRELRLDVAGLAVLRFVGYFGQGSDQVLDSVDVAVQVSL